MAAGTELTMTAKGPYMRALTSQGEGNESVCIFILSENLGCLLQNTASAACPCMYAERNLNVIFAYSYMRVLVSHGKRSHGESSGSVYADESMNGKSAYMRTYASHGERAECMCVS